MSDIEGKGKTVFFQKSVGFFHILYGFRIFQGKDDALFAAKVFYTKQHFFQPRDILVKLFFIDIIFYAADRDHRAFDQVHDKGR